MNRNQPTTLRVVLDIAEKNYAISQFLKQYSIYDVIPNAHAFSFWKIFFYVCRHIAESAYIENDAYASNFIMTSQEETVTNEITGFLN